MGGGLFLDDDQKEDVRDDHRDIDISFIDDHAARFYDDDDDNDHYLLLKNQGLEETVGHRDYFVEEDQNQPGNYNYDQEERRIYWESQEFLLQEILDQYNATGSKFREQIKRHIDIARDSNSCNCWDKNLRGFCIRCLRRAAVDQLCSKGFSAVLCTSKWKRTHKIPGGTHEYIEVMGRTQERIKQIPFLVEVGFPDELRMAKACDEYKRLIDQLPEIYIGKVEHLNAIIRVLCDAAKRSSDEQKIHMGPWRKRSFMQMKWSASNDQKRFLDQSSHEQISISTTSTSSRMESVRVVRSSFQLPMATTVKVA